MPLCIYPFLLHSRGPRVSQFCQHFHLPAFYHRARKRQKILRHYARSTSVEISRSAHPITSPPCPKLHLPTFYHRAKRRRRLFPADDLSVHEFNSHVRTFQSRIVFSSGRLLPFTKTEPSGENATVFTASTLRHFSVLSNFPVFTSHSLIAVLSSSPPLASVPLSGEKANANTGPSLPVRGPF